MNIDKAIQARITYIEENPCETDASELFQLNELLKIKTGGNK